MSGVLFVVATPIGNLEDVSKRALAVLAAADIIACEGTRHSRRLLDRLLDPQDPPARALRWLMTYCTIFCRRSVSIGLAMFNPF